MSDATPPIPPPLPPLPVSDAASEAKPKVVPPPPSFGKQLAQLVVIPALIVIACIGLAAMFGKIAGSNASIDDHLRKLGQSSGAGRMPLNLQDPRYKERGWAARNIAAMIPQIKDPAERARVGGIMLDILEHQVGPEEDQIEMYLLIALGQLGQDGGLNAIIRRLGSPRQMVRQGAVLGVMNWPRPDEAAAALPGLLPLAGDANPEVATTAAAAIGTLARPGDEAAVAALRRGLEMEGLPHREARWNAAVALAKLGDPAGNRVVADQLLNRAELAAMAASESGAVQQGTMPQAMQDRVILATLASVPRIADPAVWRRVEALADNDPSMTVRKAAKQLLQDRDQRPAVE